MLLYTSNSLYTATQKDTVRFADKAVVINRPQNDMNQKLRIQFTFLSAITQCSLSALLG